MGLDWARVSVVLTSSSMVMRVIGPQDTHGVAKG